MMSAEITSATASAQRGSGEKRIFGIRRGRLTLGVLSAALVGSLAANVYFAHANTVAYRMDCLVRLDPAGAKTYEAARVGPAPSSGKPVVAIFGDSRALMWNSSVPQLPEYQIENVGIGNQTTAQILLRFDLDVPRLRPAVIVIEAGVNDLKMVAEFPQRRQEIVADCEANLDTLVAKSEETGAVVVLLTIFAIGDIPLWRKPYWSDSVDDVVREVNVHLRGLARKNVIVLDTDPLLDGANGKIQPRYQFDFLHLAPAGYDVLNERLVSLVEGLAPAKALPPK